MIKHKSLSVKTLKLDLHNFRALPQASEIDEIRTLILSAPDWFEGLLFEIAENGYLSLEEIGILEENGQKIVLEGNRRVSVFKILLGYVSIEKLNVKLSRKAQETIESITADWKQENSKIPCQIFSSEDAPRLRHIIRRTHGVDEKAGRYTWASISKARESRDAQHKEEPELDLIENILRNGSHHTDEEQKKWLSNIKFSLFQEAAKNIASILGISSYDLRDRYTAKDLPNEIIQKLEKLVAHIGRGMIKFGDIRKPQRAFYVEWGFYQLPSTPGIRFLNSSSNSQEQPATHESKESCAQTTTAEQKTTNAPSANKGRNNKRDNSPIPGSERHCHQLIKNLQFTKFPNSQEKLQLIQKEMLKLNTETTPNAFAILFRAILDMAFTEFCNLNNLNTRDKLVSKIKEAHNHILSTAHDRTQKERDLANAFSCLVDSSSCISTAVLNVITHRPKSTAIPANLRIGIFNAMPLLKEIGL